MVFPIQTAPRAHRPAVRPSRFVQAVRTSGSAIVLLVLALALFLPGFWRLPPVDRDEARFAQASRQMMESGDYVDIRFQETTRYKKPIGIYWLQVPFAQALGGVEAPIWAYRLPSLIGASVAVLLTMWIGGLLFGRQTGFVAGLLFAATLVLNVEARLAKADAVLLAATLVAIGVLARLAAVAPAAGRESLRQALPFWLALGVGILLKGPIILLVVGAPLVGLMLFRRSFDPWRRLRPLAGLAVMLAIVLPWYAAIAWQSGGAFFEEAVMRDLLGKAAEGQESHGAPPGAHAAAFFGLAWPLSPFLLIALPWILRHAAGPSVRFCLLWIVPSWLVFELVPTKLPHYVLPLYPALAILAAAALAEKAGPKWLRVLGSLLLALVPIALAGTILIGLLVLERKVVAGSEVALVAAAIFGLGAAGALWRRRDDRAIAAAVASALALYLGAFHIAFPTFDRIWLSPRAVAAAEEHATCRPLALGATGYTEPSLVFEAGTTTLLAEPGPLAAWLASPGCRVALVEERRREDFEAALGANGVDVATARVGEVRGFNYSRGKHTTIGIYGRSDSVGSGDGDGAPAN